MVVVLPAPLGPMKPNTSPFCRLSSSDLMAYRSPYFLVRSWVSITRRAPCRRFAAIGRRRAARSAVDSSLPWSASLHRKHETIIRPARAGGIVSGWLVAQSSCVAGSAARPISTARPSSTRRLRSTKPLIVVGQAGVRLAAGQLVAHHDLDDPGNVERRRDRRASTRRDRRCTVTCREDRSRPFAGSSSLSMSICCPGSSCRSG